MDSNNEKPVLLASGKENRQITRHVLGCLNQCPELPVKKISYGMLLPDKPGLTLVTVQGAAIVKRYIDGGHRGEYPFVLLYRIKAGNSDEKRLTADEALDTIADWAILQKPNLGQGVTPIGFEITERASLDAVYEGGDEDHQILLKLTYEVI